MELSFAQMVSTTGCFSSRAGRTYIQSDAQSYITSSVRRFDVERSAVIRSILLTARGDRMLYAKVECFLYRVLTIPQWSRLQKTGVKAAITCYIEAVRQSASLRFCDVQSTLITLEKDL